MTSRNCVARAEPLREGPAELDAAIEQFDARRPETLRPVEAALDRLHARLKAATTWSEDSPEARNFVLWKAQFLGMFLDDFEQANLNHSNSGGL